MLDEAIEHLKMLQLELQVMSMRTGIGIPPNLAPKGMQPLPTMSSEDVRAAAMKGSVLPQALSSSAGAGASIFAQEMPGLGGLSFNCGISMANPLNTRMRQCYGGRWWRLSC
eukprot:TRINITY_DN6588_c0_g1_i2.p1 TRINITY_DN6588_c0_g1~~TRINITY_DN6588_c0_g1_i2.p1  ORF type:complete len:112 (-),score=18.46 TRINITY_DN6588_c0_g1_i2:49-384(-)